ncbi:MAG TPA: extracellular solute-binding protein [Candidatus Binatia bacterium]|jgi:ABC-type Fe3+ transport system substrate-binding protein
MIRVFSLIALVCASLVTARAWGQADHAAKLIEGAKKEGKLVWHTSMSVSDAKLLVDSFMKKYPFARVELVRSGGEATLNRLLSEVRAGKWDFDVVAIGGTSILIQHHLIAPYLSPEAKAYLPEFRDPAGHWTGLFNNYFVVGYNTKLVSDAESPRIWKDLLAGKWKNNISMDQEEYPLYAALLAAWGKNHTHSFIRSLAQQNIQWRKGHTLIAQLIAAGEFSLGIVYAHTVEAMKKAGAPIEWNNTLDPIVVLVNGIALSAKPNNPNLARLFIDFTLSKEGQGLVRSLNRIPARGDIDPPSPKMQQSKLQLKAVPQDMGTRYKTYVEEFRQLTGQ